MASIAKTAKGYRAQVYVRGQRDSECFPTRREAVNWAAQRENELRDNRPAGERLLMALRGYDPEYVIGLKSTSLDANFRKYRQRAGLEGFTFHDSRHTAATWMAQRIHALDLCKVMGWKNASQALTYYNPKADDIARRLSAGRSR